MSKADEIKELPLRNKIIHKHKKIWKALCIITFILFSPFALLEIINEKVEKLLEKLCNLRNKLIHSIFKRIYKKEIIENEKIIKEELKKYEQ